VADLRAQRARDGGEELQPCRRSVQRERNGKLAIMEREREREAALPLLGRAMEKTTPCAC
jgi:hypothetical protein